MENELYCSICKKKFCNLKTLIDHKKKFHLETEYKCNKCNKIFATKGYLKRHENMETSRVGLKFFCNLCNKEFFSKYNLQSHKNKKHSQVLYKCLKCKKTFSSYNYLIERHNPTCIDRKCPTCNKILSSIQMFKKHIQNCGNYKCDKCNTTFKSIKTFSNHKIKCTNLIE